MSQYDVVTKYFTKKRKHQSGFESLICRKRRKITYPLDSNKDTTDDSHASSKCLIANKKSTLCIKDYFNSSKAVKPNLSSKKNIFNEKFATSICSTGFQPNIRSTNDPNGMESIENMPTNSSIEVGVKLPTQIHKNCTNFQSKPNCAKKISNLKQCQKPKTFNDLQQAVFKIKESKEKIKLLQQRKYKKSDAISLLKHDEFAFSKYHSLSQTIPKGLVLPYKYKCLYEMFQNLDTIVSILYNRQEEISWHKIEKMVQEVTRKKFTLNHLAQIKHIFPDAYEYKYEVNKNSIQTNCIEQLKYDIILLPVLKFKKNNIGLESKLTGTMLVERKYHFYVKLINLVKEQHNSFLDSLQPPLKINDKDLKRWHPEFRLDAVTDIPYSVLPSAPNQDEYAYCNSAKEVFEKARTKLTKTAAIALKNVSVRGSNSHSSSDTSNDAILHTRLSVKTNSITADLQGVSLSLIDKIRKKEAERKVTEMLRCEEITGKLEQLKKLPDVARALRMLYTNEKRTSLPMSHLCLKLSKSCNLISDPNSISQHLRLMSNVVSSWFQIINIQGKEYGKLIDMRIRINDILDRIDKYTKALQMLTVTL